MLQRAKTYQRPVYRSYTWRPSDPDANYQFAKFGHAQKAKFSLSLLPSFFAFLASFLFSLAGHLVGFILVERVFKKAIRILGLNESKGR